MVVYLNTDSAANIWHSEDLFVITTIAAIHGVMIEEPGRSLRPIAPFDLCFFYCSVVDSVCRLFEYELSSPLPKCQLPRAINLPDQNDLEFRETEFVKTGLARIFVDHVRDQSIDAAIPFDVSHGARIAARAFDHDTLSRIALTKGKRYVRNDDWDSWLSGFSPSA